MPLLKKDEQFDFGKNWQRYIKNFFNYESVKTAKTAFTRFLGQKNLHNKKFLDIGCGSGLMSLVAHKLGAKQIVSMDINPNCIKCARYLRHRFGNSSDKWKIFKGSILDKTFIAQLGKYDLVYSWGVLHHTGKMWKAIKNSINLVSAKGYLYLAIYNKVEGWGIHPDGRFGPSKFWLRIKKIYSQLPDFLQNIILYLVALMLIILYLLSFKNPVKKIKEHTKLYRGMNWLIDIKDWLGGYPYEYASPDEVFNFCKKNGLILVNLKMNPGLMNSEYLFYKAK